MALQKSLPFAAGIAALALFATAESTHASDFAFKFRTGDVHSYQVDQQTVVEAKSGEGKVTTAAKVRLVKQWKVLEVADDGSAKLELSLTQLRFEQTDPEGQRVVFDSERNEESHPGMAEQMSKLIGRPLQQATVAKNGEVLSSKTLIERSPIRQDLPFFVQFPAEDPDSSWTRETEVTLPPPIEDEPHYEAKQTYSVTQATDDELTVEIATELAEAPRNEQHRLVLLQYVPKGTAKFDLKRGLLTSVQLTTDEIVENFAGEGSYYKFVSTHDERLMR